MNDRVALTGILFVLKTKYVELRVGDGPSLFGVGIAGSILTSSFRAILGGVNRHVAAAGRMQDAALQASA